MKCLKYLNEYVNQRTHIIVTAPHKRDLLITSYIKNTNTKIQNLKAHHYTKRPLNEFTVSEFKLNLSCVSLDEIFTEDNVDSVCNSFLNTYLRIFYDTFPLKKSYRNENNKAWIILE